MTVTRHCWRLQIWSEMMTRFTTWCWRSSKSKLCQLVSSTSFGCCHKNPAITYSRWNSSLFTEWTALGRIMSNNLSDSIRYWKQTMYVDSICNWIKMLKKCKKHYLPQLTRKFNITDKLDSVKIVQTVINNMNETLLMISQFWQCQWYDFLLSSNHFNNMFTKL